MEKEVIGKVAHYYGHVGVAVVELSGTLNIGDTISIEGRATNVQQKIDSMEIEHQKVEVAKKGQSIGLRVNDKVREGDVVYKVTATE